MSRRRMVASAAFTVLTGFALFATAGSAAADVGGEPVLRIVTVQSEDAGRLRHEGNAPGRDTDTGVADEAGLGADAL